jgi:hypothetical protein
MGILAETAWVLEKERGEETEAAAAPATTTVRARMRTASFIIKTPRKFFSLTEPEGSVTSNGTPKVVVARAFLVSLRKKVRQIRLLKSSASLWHGSDREARVLFSRGLAQLLRVLK